MNRYCLALIFALVALPIAARADESPTPEQIEQAKTAYIEGKALHDAGKLPEAIDKFKESYRLSKNPLLLYNIGFTMDEAGQKDLALFYYRKFLSDAPQNATQRAAVDKRVKEIEKEKLDADLNGKTPDANDPFGTGNNNPLEPTKTPEPARNVKIKPAGTYGADAFQHQIVEEAPPGKPLDITAFVPEDSGFTVALYYRISGEATFTSKAMRWRYKELVGRVPANKLTGTAIQYYIVVRDQAGKEIARSAKQASPNIVTVDEKAQAHFYPDFSDDGQKPVSAAQQKREDEDEDPLHPHQKKTAEAEERHEEVAPTTPGDGFRDVGSKKFFYTKWSATAGAAVFLGLGLTFAALSGKEANDLLTDSKTAPGGGGPCGTPPCRPFDSYDKALQDAGKRDALIAQVSITASIVAAGVAGYYWYKEVRAKKRHELKVGKNNASPETTWVVVPTFGADRSGASFAGAAAAARF